MKLLAGLNPERWLTDSYRSMYEIGLSGRAVFRGERRSKAYQAAYSQAEPLVSVCIATFNRGPLLLERSLKSILAQSYANFEVIVVGDCCTDDTAQRMATVTDPRVRFVNLPERGRYPEEPKLRWMVGGTAAVNHALALARGDFITHLDDDDEHTPDRLAKLVDFTLRRRADIVWHPFDYEGLPDQWHTNHAPRFRYHQVSTSSVLYHHWFRQIPWDADAYKLLEPGDWNRFRKFRFIGARAFRHPDVMLKHYRERNQQAK